jgi:hypothetical protein
VVTSLLERRETTDRKEGLTLLDRRPKINLIEVVANARQEFSPVIRPNRNPSGAQHFLFSLTIRPW